MTDLGGRGCATVFGEFAGGYDDAWAIVGRGTMPAPRFAGSRNGVDLLASDLRSCLGRCAS
jgi:hypothetical protein